jgi:hypothetical protein
VRPGAQGRWETDKDLLRENGAHGSDEPKAKVWDLSVDDAQTALQQAGGRSATLAKAGHASSKPDPSTLSKNTNACPQAGHVDEWAAIHRPRGAAFARVRSEDEGHEHLGRVPVHRVGIGELLGQVALLDGRAVDEVDPG